MIEKVQLDQVTEEKAGLDFAQMAKDAFIDVSEELPRQPVAISIGHSEYKGNHYPIPFGSYGDYSCIVGSSKSRKTFLKSAIIAGYIGGKSNNYFPDIAGHDTEGKVVIEIDTEQSKFHSQRVFRRVCEMVGTNPERYIPFSIREYNPKERFEFIDWIFNESEWRNDIGLLSIDGFVDLVTDFNSLEQATGLQEKLLTWTTQAQCHITGVLHKNFGTSKPVGHVGSSVLKKAETIVFVEKNDEVTEVKCEYSRNIPFESFNFSVNDDWLPVAENVNDTPF